MRADISVTGERLEGGEPVGALHVHSKASKDLPALEISGAIVPNLIDELPLLGFVAASIGCAMSLSDAQELRFKECDRIAATVDNLSRMGARIKERTDGWQLYAGSKLHGARLSSFGDHRIAMACAVAALGASGTSDIESARSAVAVSLPEFWTLLEGLAN